MLAGVADRPYGGDYPGYCGAATVGEGGQVHLGKLEAKLCRVTPQALLDAAEEDLRAAGLSGAKVTYVKDFSLRVLSGELDMSALVQQEDGDVVAALTRVKGIGKWTAEMFLLFSLGRSDVWAVRDLGLRNAVKWLYGLDELPGDGEMEQFGEKWRPYRSVASLYLWEAINRGLVKGPGL